MEDNCCKNVFNFKIFAINSQTYVYLIPLLLDKIAPSLPMNNIKCLNTLKTYVFDEF